MRLHDYAPYADNVPDSFPTLWPGLIDTIVKLTIQAYRSFASSRTARADWEEDVFSLNIEDHLRPIAHQHPQNFQVRSRVPVHTPEMLAGEESPKKAKEIDIQVWGGQWGQDHKVYFAWECKLIADRQKHDGKDLINEYVKNGMFRFLDGYYSAHVPNAGMLGYVLTGEVTAIVGQINDSMLSAQRERKLEKSDKLSRGQPVDAFIDLYVSSHTRVADRSSIRLHHLFLTFDFSVS